MNNMDGWGEFSKIAGIVNVLYKLKVVGFDKRTIPINMSSIDNNLNLKIKYTVRLAIIGINVEYLVLVPYKQRNKTYDFNG